ncbi:branched-chain amino acid ABC transporter permease [Catenulispora sp. NF23]|uniref:branched-chain amino acid ABC transporter permease n=1 Tax=Catenulispora pinistramenti TaxID=2705254 RepID=UPI001BA83E3A|nr:branched-chain amino acid ABC transporter permease [Catenulispora pinistramenti]MBS2539701.1 branched-chain amino acid ABC transporter permease [Catenulispora pinistramenti]
MRIPAVLLSRPVRIGVPGAALAVFLLIAPSSFDGYGISLMSKALALGVLAVSVSILAGYSGLPTMGQAAPFLVGAYTAGVMSTHGHTVGVLQLLCGTLVAAVFAAATGLVAIRTRGVAFLMTTLALGELTVTAAGEWRSLTGGTDGMYGITSIQPLPGMAALSSDRSIYWFVLTATVVVIAVVWWVLRSPVGKLLLACRDHEARMRSAGHPVTRYQWLAYVAAGALAGFGGVLMCTVNAYVSPDDGSFSNSALVLLAVVLGGATSPLGALLGAGLIVATQDWLSGPFPGHGPLLLGLMFIVAVYALPDGVAGIRFRVPKRRGGAA